MALPSSDNVCQHEGLRLFTILLITRVHIGGHAASALLERLDRPATMRATRPPALEACGRGVHVRNRTPFTEYARTHRTGPIKDRIGHLVSQHTVVSINVPRANDRARSPRTRVPPVPPGGPGVSDPTGSTDD